MKSALDAIQREMSMDRPAFIVGAPRSGTSILYRALQGHSQFRPDHCTHPTGVDLTESRIFARPFLARDRENSPAFEYMLSDNEAYDRLQEMSRTAVPFASLALRCGMSVVAPHVPPLREQIWRFMGNDRLVRLFFYFARQARGSQRTLEKTPDHINYLPEIRATFPRCRLLFVHRHPVDVYTSYRRRLGTRLDLGRPQRSARWLQLTGKRFCKLYGRHARLAYNDARQNRSMLLIAYRDLATTPGASIRQILSFLDLPFEEGCIPRDDSSQDTWGEDPLLFGSLTAHSKDWRDHISINCARQIEERLSSTMEMLGYQRYT